MKHQRRCTLIGLLLAGLLLALSGGPLLAPVSAQATTLNATSCAAQLSGTWDAASSTCTLTGTLQIAIDLTIPSGVTLRIALADVRNAGHMVNGGTILVEGFSSFSATYEGGTLTNDGVLTNHGSTAVAGSTLANNGTINSGPDPEAQVQAPTNFDIRGGATFTNYGTIRNGTAGQAMATFTIIEQSTFTNYGTIHNGAAGRTTPPLVIQGSTLNNTAIGFIDNYAVLVNNEGTINNSGTILNRCGATYMINAGSYTGTPPEYEKCVLNATVCGLLGTWDADSSTCTLMGTLQIAIDLTIPSGVTLRIALADVRNGGHMVNGGTILVEGFSSFSATYEDGTLTNDGVLTNHGSTAVAGSTLANNGTINSGPDTGAEVQAPTNFDIRGGAMFTNYGTINNGTAGQAMATFTIIEQSTFTNYGTIHNGAAGQTTAHLVTQRSTLNNAASGVIKNYHVLTHNEGTLNNTGVIDNYAVLANNYGTINNSGVINAYCGATWVGEEGTFTGNPIVNLCNTAPVANADSYSAKEDTALTVAAPGVLANDTDAENNPLTAAKSANPAHGSVTLNTNGSFSYTPAANYCGPDSFTYKANDGALDSNVATVNITVGCVNDAPLLGAIGNKTVPEMTTLAFTASATDVDNAASTLTFSLLNAPTGATITPGGAFSWIPTEEQGPGSYTFSVTVCDNVAPPACSKEEITVTVTEVNRAPVLGAVGNKSLDEMTALAFQATATDPDYPDNVLTFSLVGAPSGATITSGGAFSWTPTEAQGAGSYPFTVKVCDNGTSRLCDEEAITVSVAEVNRAPLLGALGNKSVDEMTALTFTAPASDPDTGTGAANTLSFSLPNAPTGASITSGGAFSWTPTEEQGPGSYPLTVKVCDNATPALCDSEDITVSVAEANRDPLLDPIGDRSVDEMTQLAFTASASDPDIPANTLTFSLEDAPTGASITSSGAFSWTPTEAQGPGSYDVTVKVCDGGSPELCDSEEITVAVAEVNRDPVLGAIGNKSVDEMTELAFTAKATDPDIPANTLSFSLIGTVPTGASITSSGAFSWTPTEAQGPGSYPFTVKVCDGGSPELCDSEEITVAVAEVNRPPVLDPIGNQTATWGNKLVFTATATDPDVPANTLTFSLVGAPTGATITANGAFSWTPASSQIGDRTFAVKVCDNGQTRADPDPLCDTETITIAVQKRATALVYSGNASAQYSDSTTVQATLTDNGGGSLQGTALAGKDIRFTIGTQTTSATTNQGGLAQHRIQLDQPAGTLTVASSFAGDDLYLGSTDSDPFAIIREGATVTFDNDNPPAERVTTDGGSFAGTLTLKVYVKESQPDKPDATAAPGDINNAGLSVELQPLAGRGAIALNCGSGSTTGTGYDAVKTFTCTYQGELEVNTYDLVATVAGDYYTGEGYDGFTVYDPSLGFATGGGWFYWPGTTEKTNFGFTMKYNKKATNVQGGLLVIRHHADGTISRLKSNALDGLALKDSDGCGIATFSGKSTYMTWDPEANDGLGDYVTTGGNLFSVYAEDCDEPGTGVDSFWVRSLDKLAMSKPAAKQAVPIGGGNIAVPHRPE